MPAPDPPPSESAPGRRVGGPLDSPEWVEKALDAVFRYARRRLPPADAEDVAQQAFEALFRAAAEGRPPADPGAYLLGVARRRVADLWRGRARRPEPVPLPAGEEGFAEAPLPAEVLEREEVRERVHVALGLLPPGEREILLGRYREDLATEEVARRLQVSTKAVEMRLARAREHFAARYREAGSAHGEGQGAGAGGAPE